MTDEEFNEAEAQLLAGLPEELRSCISHMAYDRGHAYGREEVLGHVRELVYHLEAPIAELIERVTQEARSS